MHGHVGGFLRICCTESERRTPHVKKAMCTLWQSQDSVDCESTGDFTASFFGGKSTLGHVLLDCDSRVGDREYSRICSRRIVEPVASKLEMQAGFHK